MIIIIIILSRETLRQAYEYLVCIRFKEKFFDSYEIEVFEDVVLSRGPSH